MPIMANKKVFSTSIDTIRIKDLKHLAVDTDKTLGDLLEEAIKDIVKKYREKMKTIIFVLILQTHHSIILSELQALRAGGQNP